MWTVPVKTHGNIWVCPCFFGWNKFCTVPLCKCFCTVPVFHCANGDVPQCKCWSNKVLQTKQCQCQPNTSILISLTPPQLPKRLLVRSCQSLAGLGVSKREQWDFADWEKLDGVFWGLKRCLEKWKHWSRMEPSKDEKINNEYDLKNVLSWGADNDDKMVRIRAVESESLKVGKSLKIGKNRIKSEKSDLMSYQTFWQKCQNAIKYHEMPKCLHLGSGSCIRISFLNAYNSGTRDPT